MTPSAGAALAVSARQSVARSIARLRQEGQAMEACGADLECAREAMEKLAAWLRNRTPGQPEPALGESLRTLGSDLARVQALLEQGLAIQQGRYRYAANALSGYSRHGGMVEPEARSGWLVEV